MTSVFGTIKTYDLNEKHLKIESWASKINLIQLLAAMPFKLIQRQGCSSFETILSNNLLRLGFDLGTLVLEAITLPPAPLPLPLPTFQISVLS